MDTARLFDGADPLYAVWLHGVINRINATRTAQRKREEAAINAD